MSKYLFELELEEATVTEEKVFQEDPSSDQLAYEWSEWVWTKVRGGFKKIN